MKKCENTEGVLKKFINLQIRNQTSNLQIYDNQTIRLKNQHGG